MTGLTSELLLGASSSRGPATSTDLWGLPLGHGDANEWHMSGSATDLVDLLISSYDLEYRKPQGAGHSHQWRRAGLCVHLQKLCSHHHCSQAISAVERRQLAALPQGSDHFFLRCTFPLRVSPARCDDQPLPPRLDRKPTLRRAHQDLLHWSSRHATLLRPLSAETDRTSTLDDIFVSLRTHAPSQRHDPRRRQPAWWTPECTRWCVA